MFYEYCRTRLGVLYNGDALEVLPTIKENTIDLVITDPPYFVLNEKWDKFKDIREYTKFTLDWLSEVYRVLKEGGQVYVFWSQKFLFEFYKILEQTKFTFKRLLIWYHPNLSVPTSKMYLWTYDPIFYLVKGDKAKCFHSSFIRKHNRDVFIIPKPQTWGNKKRLHIAQKPLKLAEIFILNSSDPDESNFSVSLVILF